MRKVVGIDFRIPVANLIVRNATDTNSSSKTREQKIETVFYYKDLQNTIILRRLDAEGYRRFQIENKTRKHNDTSSEQFCEDMPNDQKATSNLLDTKTTT